MAYVPRYPGATWRPAGTDAGQMSEIRGVSLHEAVTTASSVYGWQQQSNACHLFTAEDGSTEQYKEFGAIAFGVLNGNKTMLTWETWDGLLHGTERNTAGLGANETVWTWQQCERIADGLAWLHIHGKIPLRLMASSARSERGIAPHRWGVRPWKAANGESWTAHDGKACPGNRRIEQIPGIIARAIERAADPNYKPIPAGPISAVIEVSSATNQTEKPAVPTKTELIAMAQIVIFTMKGKKYAAQTGASTYHEILSSYNDYLNAQRGMGVDVKEWKEFPKFSGGSNEVAAPAGFGVNIGAVPQQISLVKSVGTDGSFSAAMIRALDRINALYGKAGGK